jgi:hypothetical protein
VGAWACLLGKAWYYCRTMAPQPEAKTPKIVPLEREKLAADLVKHISTLATGSIVIITTLLDKLPKPIQLGEWLIYTVILFATCTAACVLYMLRLGVVAHWLDEEADSRVAFKFYITLGFIIFMTFILGIVCLCVFAVKNLLFLINTSN